MFVAKTELHSTVEFNFIEMILRNLSDKGYEYIRSIVALKCNPNDNEEPKLRDIVKNL